MKTLVKIEMVLGLILVAAFGLSGSVKPTLSMHEEISQMLTHQRPHPPAIAFEYSIFRTAPLEVAKVFGRTPGCADAPPELINETAQAAVDANLDPATFAATAGVESSCNPLAVSSRGAVGMMQIVPKIWIAKYDFAGKINLFNRTDNLRVGAQIEASLIAQYGVEGGIRRYNGLGTGCETCDSGYVTKILTLAGRRP